MNWRAFLLGMLGALVGVLLVHRVREALDTSRMVCSEPDDLHCDACKLSIEGEGDAFAVCMPCPDNAMDFVERAGGGR